MKQKARLSEITTSKTSKWIDEARSRAKERTCVCGANMKPDHLLLAQRSVVWKCHKCGETKTIKS